MVVLRNVTQVVVKTSKPINGEGLYYGKPFWTKAVEFFSDGREFSRTVENFLGRSRIFSDDREFSRTVENFLGRSRIFSDGREFSWTVEILNFLRQSRMRNTDLSTHTISSCDTRF